jgi:NAD(P)H-dependent FMN reductase
LPLFDEPEHPRLRRYQHAHTQAWSAPVDRADAFVLVTPEYNYGTPPSLVNACDYLLHEWAYKPAGFVSYGGAAGGMRGVMMTRQLLMTLKVVPIVEAVAIPAFTRQIDPESGAFRAEPHQERAAKAMLDELHRWAGALRTLRASRV